ncbi:MAG TPA: amino acid adenylation domain-containing protein [Streptosporangiaceae bacterium]|nr:amino acid adenylation domain-containing protein [Streptosporangiaceae bacterium]
MSDVNDPGETAQDAFTVVVNGQGQHSLWQAFIDLPAGWRRRSAVMPRHACLDAIAGAWHAITPASVLAGAQAKRYKPGSASGRARFVHERFAQQASRRPGAAAVIAAGTQLTYRELDESANRLARRLVELGAGPETLVGVHAERGAGAIRSLLAILKAGSGYLPLDPSLPPARLAQICAEASPIAILTDRPVGGSAASRTRVLAISELAADLGRQPATAPEAGLHPDHLCYAIHTSGSTGQPKAVAVSHGSLACVITALTREYRISARDRVVQLAAAAFDTSVEQILVTLASGATLLLPPPGTIAPTDLLRYVEHQQVTVVDLTPAYWHQLLAVAGPDDERLRSVRLMITGGEMADPADCGALMRAAPRARLLNAYGLTETTITSALFDVSASPRTAESAARVPVGQPVRRARIMVLDEALRPVPAGVTGEVYVGGCGVARGYLGRPALTAERFLPDPGGRPGSRMYRTGDLGRFLQDGTLDVTGRADRQLKVRGFRIEPAEIESVLAEHPDIAQATVVVTGQGPGNTRLAAYYVVTPGAATPQDPPDHGGAARPPMPPGPTAASLRSFLRERLPGYMIPVLFVALDQMPRATDGEPARDALGQPVTAPAQHDEEAPRTPVQAGLTYLWSELLKTDHVGLDDDFFALGGNSLLAAEMLAHARVMFGIGADYVRPLTRSLLRDPTLRAFAEAAQDARAGRLAVHGHTPVDYAREAEFTATVRPHADPRYGAPDWRKPREILLTGSTGFFGAHLLSELLAATTARVWCLVRAPDAARAMARITEAAARYDLADVPAGRVVPLPGDLASPRLGLSPGQFCELARSVDVIHHAGAAVNFIYPYEELRAANVTGTREVIRLAAEARRIPVHFVSTTAVLAGLGVMGVREVTEETPLAHADRLDVGYVETKFVAEELLRNAARAGLPVAIYRPLDIVGSLRSGAWNTAAEMCALVRFVTDTGLAPDIDLPLDFVPADTCAAAIRHISAGERAAGQTYHLASPEHARLGFLVDRLRAYGYCVSELPYEAWVSELLRYAAQHPSHPMTPFLPLFIDRDPESGLTPAEMYFEHVFPHYTRANTERALQGSGIVFPPVDRRLVDLNIGHLIAQGYLKAPGDIRLPVQRTGSQVPDRPAHAG